MVRGFLFAIFFVLLIVPRARAIAATVSYDSHGNPVYTYNDADPDNSQVADWNDDAAWGVSGADSGITGWDYVGTVSGASGTYLGNGWVITAGHVSPGDFTITNGPAAGTYVYSGNSMSVGNADLTLFQLTTMPSLPALTLAADPFDFMNTSAGANTVMIGFGSAATESWGYNNITLSNQSVAVNQFTSNDFFSALGSVHNFTANSPNNMAEIIAGDSGGGDFVEVGGKWELAGINEVDGTGVLEFYQGKWVIADSATLGALDAQNVTVSGSVTLGSYATTINNIEATPEPPAWQMVLAGLVALGGWRIGRRQMTGHV